MDSGWEVKNWKDSNPLGKKAENFLRDNSDFCIYLHSNTDSRCPEHGDLSGGTSPKILDQDPLCKKCWGTGKIVKAEIVPVRIVIDSGTAQSDYRFAPGYITSNLITGFFPRKVRPDLHDLVIAVEWNIPVQNVPKDKNRRPIRVTSIMQIVNVFERFEREYSYVGCTLQSYDIEKRTANRMLPLMLDLNFLEPEIQNQWTETQAGFW